MESVAMAMSRELRRSVPWNNMCSMKCEIPACAGASNRDPILIQIPSAADRTLGISSVTRVR